MNTKTAAYVFQKYALRVLILPGNIFLLYS